MFISSSFETTGINWSNKKKTETATASYILYNTKGETKLFRSNTIKKANFNSGNKYIYILWFMVICDWLAIDIMSKSFDLPTKICVHKSIFWNWGGKTSSQQQQHQHNHGKHVEWNEKKTTTKLNTKIEWNALETDGIKRKELWVCECSHAFRHARRARAHTHTIVQTERYTSLNPSIYFQNSPFK